jgi:arabinosaccharide transport system substrate-binding protein
MNHAMTAILLSLRSLPAGVWVIGLLLIVSGIVLFQSPKDQSKGSIDMWVFSPEHQQMYLPMIESDLDRIEAESVELSILSIAAIKSRMMSGFFGGLPTADLIEVERATVGQVFMGPVEAIGFRDLTDQLEAEGLLEGFNPPSLSPWSVNGRVFGLPHDVHPVMLAYRADITEAAGIDLQQAETWDQFFEMLKPLMGDEDGDGRADHYPLSMWYTQQDNIELLLMQGDGQMFDKLGRPTVNLARNAELLAKIVSWCVGDDRRVIDINEFSAAGHQARVDGDAIAYLCPDWMCSIWKMHVPLISGKMKLMPLPAFEQGGRRTSVRGGTMLGFPKASTQFDSAWEAAKLLYTSPEIARTLYEEVDIITPVKALWSDPIYDVPDPFFMDQPKGRMFIELASDIPLRTSSPYNQNAILEARDAAVLLARYAEQEGVDDPELLMAEAQRLLDIAQENVVRQMSRNAFARIE